MIANPRLFKRIAKDRFFYPTLLTLLLTPLVAERALATDEKNVATDALASMSIDQLVNLEVTSASKKAEKASDVAAALYVITQEDIRRSGATSIPEALRMAPGVNVARIDGSQWAISARGFNAVFGDKLLVLLDGRSIYTPLFGGSFWNEHDTLLADIERIEVIRGPGATLWGANATNGVINIITKSATDTDGTYLSAGGGTEENLLTAARYAGLAGKTHYRVYAKHFSRDGNTLASTGDDANDTTTSSRAGFRTDTHVTDEDLITVQGDFYYGESGQDLTRPTLEGTLTLEDEKRYINGGNLVGRWTREISETSEASLQLYYDRIERDDEFFIQERDTFDIDFQHRFSPASRHDVIWGLGYRFYTDDHEGTFTVSIDPESRDINLYTGFIQDEITLVEDTLRFIIGTKLEKNAFSDWEVMPNARIVATPGESHTVWAAISRAVRSPARFNHDGRLVLTTFTDPDSGLPTVVSGLGDREYDAEDLLAYEIGYRTSVSDWLSIDVAAFFNDYSDLESFEPKGDPFLSSVGDTPFIEVPFAVDNLLKGDTTGVEVGIDVRPFDWWKIAAWYSYLNIDITPTKGSVDTIFSAAETQSPEHQYMIRSLINVTSDIEFDTTVRFVDDVKTFDIDDYTEVDVHLGWRIDDGVRLDIYGQNLVEDSHAEFTSNLVDTARTEIDRGVYGKVTLEF